MDKKTALRLIENFEGEIWKPLYIYSNYLLSNYGRIKSIERTVTVFRKGKTYITSKPQHIIKLRTNGIEEFLFADIYFRDDKDIKIRKTIYIHRAVCDHFVEKPKHIVEYENDGGHICASHIIKDYENNRFDNVKWITQIELIQSQPNRLANPTKAWETRREIYGSTGANSEAKTGKCRKPKVEKLETEII